MLSIKVCYNSEDSDGCFKIDLLLKAKGNPLFEYCDENDFKQKKTSWKYKGAAGAREIPFVAVYKDKELIKAFYSEDESATDSNVLDFVDAYNKEQAKKGYMTITKVEGNNNEHYLPGTVHSGYTKFGFIEGISLLLDCGDRWFRTSPVTSIDWEKKVFHTCNSTYSFTLDESTRNQENN